MAKYTAIFTTYGTQVLAKAIANNQPLRVTHFAVGDGNGNAVTVSASQERLVNEKYRATISAVSLDPRNNKQVIFELTIPEDIGGFYIREMGVFDANNKLVAYANCPESFKPTLASGSGKVQVMRMILLVASSNAVTLTVDDSVIFVTRGQLTPHTITATSSNGFDQNGHSHAIDKASTTKLGIVQLTNDTGLDSEYLGLTAKAGKKLAQLIATVQLALNNYIPLNKRSSAVNSNDENNVATSKAVKTAYDKGVEAKNAADGANNNANGRVSKSGDTMTGPLNIKFGDYSFINQFNSSGKFSRIETTPDDQSNFYKLSYWSGDTELHSALLPKRGQWKVVAYEDWVNDRYVPRTGDTIINGRPTFINNGEFITIKSTGVNWASIDYKMWNSPVPLVTIQAEDLGNYSGAFNIFTTPEGQDYNTDRREKTAQIHHNGRIWSKRYGWLDEQFAPANDTHKKSRCHNHWFPSHYAGTEVVDLPVDDTGGIRMTLMNVKVNDYHSPYVDIYLPMAYSGFANAIASDDGSEALSYGTDMIGNNIVRVYCKRSGNIGFRLHVIGWANF
nr:MAG TPA: tail collar fiber protein [Caudoviricetes sp.]